MKIAYITVKLPYGKQETFIIPEIKEVLRQGHEVIILPFRPDNEIFHKEAESLKDITYHAKIFAFKVFTGSVFEFFSRPLKGVNIIGKVLFNSRNINIAFKNLSTIPKGFYTARVFRQAKVEHIHAHWASTPSTVAYIASCLTDIPWSFTAHRIDIAENNLLKVKAISATFVRAIDKKGRMKIIDTLNDSALNEKVKVIHMGVHMPETVNFHMKREGFISIICPANLYLIKGHKYLIEACKFLFERGVKFKCLIAGDGYLAAELKSLVSSFHLEGNIEFLGRIPHEKLIEMYQKGKVDLVVLPSIITEDGEKEGIPVALMEAMAHGIPVISTPTGGIPELVKDAGLLVPPEDPNALANAITQATSDTLLYRELQVKGRKRVEESFEIGRNTATIISMIRGQSHENL